MKTITACIKDGKTGIPYQEGGQISGVLGLHLAFYIKKRDVETHFN